MLMLPLTALATLNECFAANIATALNVATQLGVLVTDCCRLLGYTALQKYLGRTLYAQSSSHEKKVSREGLL